MYSSTATENETVIADATENETVQIADATENETVIADATENETVIADATENETVIADEKNTDLANICSEIGHTSKKTELKEGFYAFEKILKKKKKKGQFMYQVKWVGFKKPTWEPEANVPEHLRI
ncbi:uncharacterized protein [Antedon mediterranea]|uniref:uncharacterized protein n=1 Tax=Antedon mediterranea TaxID=105859 RepID=UPI003AF76ACE